MPRWTFSKYFCLSNRLFQDYCSPSGYYENNCNHMKTSNALYFVVLQWVRGKQKMLKNYNSFTLFRPFFSISLTFFVSMFCIIPTSLSVVLKCQRRPSSLDLHGWSIPEVIGMSTQQITVDGIPICSQLTVPENSCTWAWPDGVS